MSTLPVKWCMDGMHEAPELISGTAGSFLNMLESVLVTGFGTTVVDALSYNVDLNEAIATITALHTFKKDQVIEIAGADQAEYNGQWRVTKVTAQNIHFKVGSVPSSNGTGTITIKTPGAGWTMPFVSADGLRACFKPNNAASLGKSDVYWYVDNTSSLTASWSPTTSSYHSFVLVRGYEEVVDIDTRLGEFGDGLIGTRGDLELPRNWMVIADDKSMYFFCHEYDYVNIHAWGELTNNRGEGFKDAFAILGNPHTSSSGGYRYTYFGDFESEEHKRVCHGGSPNIKNHMFKTKSFVSSAQSSFLNFPGSSGKVIFTPLSFCYAPELDYYTYGDYLGGLPGVNVPLTGRRINDMTVFTGENGRLYLSRNYTGSGRNPKNEYESYFDITGPWE